MIQKSVHIKLEGGLEARKAALLVQAASQYESSVHIETSEKRVNAKSIMGMMSLGLGSGDAATIVADGSDEETAAAEIENFLNGR